MMQHSSGIAFKSGEVERATLACEQPPPFPDPTGRLPWWYGEPQDYIRKMLGQKMHIATHLFDIQGQRAQLPNRRHDR
jgi:hypothetical protein